MSPINRLLIQTSTSIVLWTVCVAHGKDPQVTFEEHIQPVLKTHCFYCHGEGDERESQLDLRLRRWIVKGGESGPAVKPGHPDQSLLLERVARGEMPPGEDKRLSDKQVELIKTWIFNGAPTLQDEPTSIDDQPHFTVAEHNWWSFQPIKRPPIPASQADSAIDAFILDAMRSHAMKGFAPLADRRTLIRRLYLDMLGLPPAPEKTSAFVNDKHPAAWGHLVDEVLASPQYGERWGRHWLDVTGYADSEGYTEKDAVRDHAFRYRDYVIQAFNQGLPYDQFIQEQLAGDELAGWPGTKLSPDVVRQLVATGFLRMAPDGTGSSGVDQPTARNQVIADTLQIVGVALLGMTVNCAQCHDHRYDPIPQTDYYSLRAVFEPAMNWKHWRAPAARKISLYTSDDIAQRNAIEAKAKLADAKRQARVDFYIQRTLEHELLMAEPSKQEPLRKAFKTASAQRSVEQKQLLQQHINIANITAGSLYLYDRRRDARANAIDARRTEIAMQAALRIRQHALDGLDAMTRDQLTAALRINVDHRTEEQQRLLADHPQAAVDASNITTVDPKLAVKLEPYEIAAAEIRKFRIATELKKLADEATAIRDTIPTEPFVRPLTEQTQAAPATFVFHRGDHQQPRKQVMPAGLSILDLPLESVSGVSTSGRRLSFAKHLTRRDHPLVSRVMVNRIWLHHFGRGLVGTPGDFGRLGVSPTHPKLLDYLASELMESAWRLKPLHRQILTSRVYQQSATTDPAVVTADPENRWYGRWTPRRLEAESVRDSILSVAGHLNPLMFGEPVPVMEDGVGQIILGRENLDGERKPTKAIPLHGHEFRRSIYIQVRRSRPLSVMESFDLANTAPHCAQRASSNVTPQALMLMNSHFVVSMAKRFAKRLVSETPSNIEAQIRRGWELAYGRTASDAQVEHARTFLVEQAKVAKDKDLALATFCQALLSSSRFLYIE